MNDDFGVPEPVAPAAVRLSGAQTAAAKARVEPCAGGFHFWRPRVAERDLPVYPSRAEAEAASIQEWRDNL